MKILDGKVVSQAVKDRIKAETIALPEGRRPQRATVVAGTDGASETYVASKIKNCEEVGFKSTLVRLNADVTENELLSHIKALNENEEVDGILVQLPLPAHINDEKVIELIN